MPAAVDVDNGMVAKSHQVINNEPQPLVVGGTDDIDAVCRNSTTHQDNRNAGGKIIERRRPELSPSKINDSQRNSSKVSTARCSSWRAPTVLSTI